MIDNLEPALDAVGKFIKPHRLYVELLRILCDPLAKSITLITSRERLRESSITAQHYLLSNLSNLAWKTFFKDHGINADTSTFDAIHKAYGGNAKAMEIISGVIQEDHGGDINAYWHSNKQDLLCEYDLADLVEQQFNRLQKNDSNAYNLLCRMSCYRYQDIPDITENGLRCLLWDSSDILHTKIIRSLRDRSLVEFKEKGYYLHPVVRAEGIKRLRLRHKDWIKANLQAARFWKLSNRRNPAESLKNLEAYYHFVAIEDWKGVFEHLLDRQETSIAFYAQLRSLGYINKCLDISKTLLCNITSANKAIQADLYAYIGDLNVISGDLISGMSNYHKSLSIFDETQKLKDFSQDYFKASKDYKRDHKADVRGSFAFLLFYMAEYQESIKLFHETLDDAIELGEEGNKFIAYVNSCLSLVYINTNNIGESLLAMNAAYALVSSLEETVLTWIRTYGFYSLGYSLIFHGQVDKAREILVKLETYASQSFNKQAEGLSLCLSAEIHKHEKDYERTIKKISLANKIFNEIGAKCDLAESHYQLGMVYKLMGNSRCSNFEFGKAIQLFSEIKAVKRAEKAQKEQKFQ